MWEFIILPGLRFWGSCKLAKRFENRSRVTLIFIIALHVETKLRLIGTNDHQLVVANGAVCELLFLDVVLLHRLADGRRVAKDHPRVDAMGEVDTLNSHIGLLLADLAEQQSKWPGLGEIIEVLAPCQHRLFDLGGELAMPDYQALQEADVGQPASQEDGAFHHFGQRGPRRPLSHGCGEGGATLMSLTLFDTTGIGALDDAGPTAMASASLKAAAVW